jgi:hypothetical protein
MLTISTTGDDAWETDARLLRTIRGFQVQLPAHHLPNTLTTMGATTFEVEGPDDDDRGEVLLRPVVNGERMGDGDTFWIDASGITIEVL